MSNKLSPTTVFENEIAELEKFFLNIRRHINGHNTEMERFWSAINKMKEQQLYTFTREELEKVLAEAFRAGWDSIANDSDDHISKYIQSLF